MLNAEDVSSNVVGWDFSPVTVLMSFEEDIWVLPGLPQGFDGPHREDLLTQGEQSLDRAGTQRAPGWFLVFISEFAVGKIGLVIVNMNDLPTLRTDRLLQ